MKLGMAWAHATSDGFRDALEEFGEPLMETIREAEGLGPRNQLLMALDWVSMEPMLP